MTYSEYNEWVKAFASIAGLDARMPIQCESTPFGPCQDSNTYFSVTCDSCGRSNFSGKSKLRASRREFWSWGWQIEGTYGTDGLCLCPKCAKEGQKNDRH